MDLGAQAVDPVEALLGNVPQRPFAQFGADVNEKLNRQHGDFLPAV